MAGRVGEIERQRESVERPALAAEQLLQDALFGAEERVRHGTLGLEPRPHQIEHPWPELSGGLELVEGDHDALPGLRGQCPRQIEGSVEEPLGVLLASQLERELEVLVPHLHRRPHARGTGLRYGGQRFSPRARRRRG